VTLAGGTLLASLASPASSTLNDRGGVSQASALSRDGLAGSDFRQSGTGVTTRTIQEKVSDIRDVRDYGVVADSSDGVRGSDQTGRLLAVFKDLLGDGFRGAIHIPYGVKFDVSALYPQVPVGVTLYDDSSVNWGQPPAYKSRLRIEYSQDAEADDAQRVIASSHHPAVMLLNFGTAGSEAAQNRLASLIHGIGRDHLGDPLVGWLMQFGRDQVEDKWNWGLRLQTPYSVARANPRKWAPGSTYAPGAYCIGYGNRIFQTTDGGVSGGQVPYGTGVVSDGRVRWTWVQEGLNVDRTVLDLKEDGRLAVYGLSEGRLDLSGGGHTAYHAVSADGIVRWRDHTRGLDIQTITDSFGLRQGIAGSEHWLGVTGRIPDAPVTGAGKVTNQTPTVMDALVPPADRVTMTVVFRFDDSNTTLRHGSSFRLRGDLEVTPAAGSFLTLKLDRTETGAWREFHRSF